MAAWLYRRPDSAKWWIGWRINRRRAAKSTRTADKKEAEKALKLFELLQYAKDRDALNNEMVEALLGKPVATITLHAAVQDWLLECEGTTAPNTHRRYQTTVFEFLEALKATPEGPLLKEVDSEQVRAFLTAKRAKCSAATTNLNRRILAVFFLRAMRNGILKANPMLPIKRFKAAAGEQASRRALTLEELALLYDKAPSLFWRYMVKGGFYTGLRMGDLITLRYGTIDFTEGFLRLTARKTGRSLQIPIALPFRAVLDEICKKRRGIKSADFLWPDEAERYELHGSKVFSNEFYEKVLMPSGLAAPRDHKGGKKKGRTVRRDTSGVSFHCLRHTFVSFLKITGSNSAVAKELAGHSSDAVNAVYTHLPADTLAEAIRQLPESFRTP